MRALISKVLTGSMIAGARLAVSSLEDEAKALFDAEPHKHPAGLAPNWDLQPESVKQVFRKRAAATRHHIWSML